MCELEILYRVMPAIHSLISDARLLTHIHSHSHLQSKNDTNLFRAIAFLLHILECCFCHFHDIAPNICMHTLNDCTYSIVEKWFWFLSSIVIVRYSCNCCRRRRRHRRRSCYARYAVAIAHIILNTKPKHWKQLNSPSSYFPSACIGNAEFISNMQEIRWLETINDRSKWESK